MIIGRSPGILRAKALVDRFAPTRIPFLLVGPTGTGKELFAEYIHQRSGRSGPLVDVNCGALPREMVESLLFGHRRGAFTGATESVEGHVGRSSGGTLFLDELGSLPPDGQVKLLRVLEGGSVQPLGEASKRTVDLRVVGAVQGGILHGVEAGHFRRDLYQRLAGVVVELKPLAARREDILPLAQHFAMLQGQQVEGDSEAVLLNYTWPGNVRELRLAIERAGQLVEDGTLPSWAVAEGIALGAPTEEARSAPTEGRSPRLRPYHAIDRDNLVLVCERASWRIADAAQVLGISRASLYRRLQALRIATPRLKSHGH